MNKVKLNMCIICLAIGLLLIGSEAAKAEVLVDNTTRNGSFEYPVIADIVPSYPDVKWISEGDPDYTDYFGIPENPWVGNPGNAVIQESAQNWDGAQIGVIGWGTSALRMDLKDELGQPIMLHANTRYTLSAYGLQPDQGPCAGWYLAIGDTSGAVYATSEPLVGSAFEQATVTFESPLEGDGLRIELAKIAAECSAQAWFDSATLTTETFVGLIPDTFEDYATGSSDPDFTTRWSTSSGTIEVSTADAYGDAQSMKAVSSGASTITKQIPSETFDYSGLSGRLVGIWYKGDAGNTTGDLTLTVTDSSNDVYGTTTIAGATQETEWTRINILIDDEDPNDWKQSAKVKIDVGAAATMYFDDLTFQIPVVPPKLALEWKFDTNQVFGGETWVPDTSGNSTAIWAKFQNFTGNKWQFVSGRSSDTRWATVPDDEALQFGVDPQYEVYNDTLNLAPELNDYFRGESSWAINQWVYLDPNYAESPVHGVLFGGFGDSDGGVGSCRYLKAINGAIGFYDGSDYNTGYSFLLGQWQMITITYDKWIKTCRIYRNAQEIGSFSLLPVEASKMIRICTKDGFNGIVDDFRLYDGNLAWEDDDPAVDDVITLWDYWVCPTFGVPESVLVGWPTGDINGDCRVNIVDLAGMAYNWLTCERYPQSFCD